MKNNNKVSLEYTNTEADYHLSVTHNQAKVEQKDINGNETTLTQTSNISSIQNSNQSFNYITKEFRIRAYSWYSFTYLLNAIVIIGGLLLLTPFFNSYDMYGLFNNNIMSDTINNWLFNGNTNHVRIYNILCWIEMILGIINSILVLFFIPIIQNKKNGIVRYLKWNILATTLLLIVDVCALYSIETIEYTLIYNLLHSPKPYDFYSAFSYGIFNNTYYMTQSNPSIYIEVAFTIGIFAPALLFLGLRNAMNRTSKKINHMIVNNQ